MINMHEIWINHSKLQYDCKMMPFCRNWNIFTLSKIFYFRWMIKKSPKEYFINNKNVIPQGWEYLHGAEWQHLTPLPLFFHQLFYFWWMIKNHLKNILLIIIILFFSKGENISTELLAAHSSAEQSGNTSTGTSVASLSNVDCDGNSLSKRPRLCLDQVAS